MLASSGQILGTCDLVTALGMGVLPWGSRVALPAITLVLMRGRQREISDRREAR